MRNIVLILSSVVLFFAVVETWGSNPSISLLTAIRDSSQEEPQTLIGKKYLDVREKDPQGKPHRLSRFVGNGKWLLIDFWASWCGPCRSEMPNVVKAYRKYHDKGFEIVGFSLDVDIDAWKEAISTWGMSWTHLSDLKGWQSKAGQMYGIQGIPDNFLVSPDGIIVARDLRGDDLDEFLSRIFEQ